MGLPGIASGGAAVGSFASMSPAVSQVSRSTKTRLRFLRRLALLVVFLVVGAIALAQFTELERLAAGVLASTAVLAAIIGFAAQKTIGNMVAGVQLAVAQPFKIGDRIEFEEVSGRVIDITLSYTYVNPGDDSSDRHPQPAAGRGDHPQPLDRRHPGLSAGGPEYPFDDEPAEPPTTAPWRRPQQGGVRRRRDARPPRRPRDRGHLLGARRRRGRASLSSCKPVEEGGNSVVYAGDGSKLGVVASDEARTPVP